MHMKLVFTASLLLCSVRLRETEPLQQQNRSLGIKIYYDYLHNLSKNQKRASQLVIKESELCI